MKEKILMRCEACLLLFDENKAKEHLAECNFNPAMKTCTTCEHAFEAGSEIFGPLRGCEKGCNPDENKKGGCPFWEEEK